MTDYLVQSGTSGLWPAVTYFSLWAVRLSGFLAPMELTEQERTIAEEMLRKPVADLTPLEWNNRTCAPMRRKLYRLLEDHIERKLITVPHLEAL